MVTETKPANQNQPNTKKAPREKKKSAPSKIAKKASPSVKTAQKKPIPKPAAKKETAKKSAHATPKKKAAPATKSKVTKPKKTTTPRNESFNKITPNMASEMSRHFENYFNSNALNSGNFSSDAGKAMSEEMLHLANKNLSENIELSQGFFTCRTINDAFDLQNQLLNKNMDNWFNQSAKFSEMFFQIATEATEPLNESFTKATEEFNKILSA